MKTTILSALTLALFTATGCTVNYDPTESAEHEETGEETSSTEEDGREAANIPGGEADEAPRDSTSEDSSSEEDVHEEGYAADPTRAPEESSRDPEEPGREPEVPMGDSDGDPWDGLDLELTAEYSHPLFTPHGFYYCGEAYDLGCHLLQRQCAAMEGSFECLQTSVDGECNIWGACREKVDLSYSSPDGGALPPLDIAIDPQAHAACTECNAICQTVSLFGSAYDEQHLGGGYTPSGCVDAAQDLCEGGASRWLFSANCVM